MSNPIRYISRTYTDIINDLNNDSLSSDKPFFIKSMFAGVFAALSTMINILVNQFFISTVQALDIGTELFKLNDYTLKGNLTSNVFVDFTINPTATATSSYTLPASSLIFMTAASQNTPQYQFESRTSITIPMGQTSGIVQTYQQKTVTNVSLGFTTGQSLQIIDLPDKDILTETIVLTIGTDLFTAVDSFAFYPDPLAKVFIHSFRSDRTSYITMPFIDSINNVQYGLIEPVGIAITANYATGGGDGSNVDANTITIYTGGDSNVLTCSNALAATGGAEPELLEQAKVKVPLMSRTHDMFWDATSGRSLALEVSGVLQAQCASTGILKSDVFIIPNGGGYPSNTLKQNVKDFLISRSSFEQVTINVYDPNYVSLTIAGSYEIKSGYVATDVYKFLIFCAYYRSYELSFYIYQYYKSNGVESTITIINSLMSSLLGYSYSYATDGVQIKKILDNVPFINMGDTIRPNDITSACMSYVDGIQYVTITSFGSAPTVSFGGVIQPVSVGFALA